MLNVPCPFRWPCRVTLSRSSVGTLPQLASSARCQAGGGGHKEDRAQPGSREQRPRNLKGPRGPQSGGRRVAPCDTRRLQARDGQQQEPRQVCFQGTFPADPVVGIIGGGLSGLVLAIELAQRGIRSVVFDTGEHGVGGRLGTRAEEDGSLPGAPPGVSGLIFDHAAQYFTATEPEFQQMVARWEAGGAVRQWAGVVGELSIGGGFTPLRDAQPRYIASGGMRSLANYLGEQATRALQHHQQQAAGPLISGLVEVRRPQWVSDLIPLEEEGRWRVVGRGREQGLFDAVVIAHNGKCANRLAAPAGIPQVYNQLRRLKLSANWVCMVAFSEALPAQFEGAFIQESSVLSWAGNNTAKLGLQRGGVECWTLISTQEYGRLNKVPQESVPQEVRERVAKEMVEELGRCLGCALPPPAYTRVQLWGAALPLNSPGVSCIWDPQGRAGICGDWVHSGGSMQAAALSGKALAERIASMRGLSSAEAAQLAVGLQERLQPVGGRPIGQFPTADGAHGKRQKQQQQQQGPKCPAGSPTPARPQPVATR